MDKMPRAVSYLSVAFIGLAAVVVIFLTPSGVKADTVTTTITGWNVPNGTTLGYGLVPFLLPLIFMGLFTGVTRGMGVRGSVNTLLIKVGLLIGSVLGMLSLTSTAASQIPFAIPVVAAIYLITYLWKGV